MPAQKHYGPNSAPALGKFHVFDRTGQILLEADIFRPVLFCVNLTFFSDLQRFFRGSDFRSVQAVQDGRGLVQDKR